MELKAIQRYETSALHCFVIGPSNEIQIFGIFNSFRSNLISFSSLPLQFEISFCFLYCPNLFQYKVTDLNTILVLFDGISSSYYPGTTIAISTRPNSPNMSPKCTKKVGLFKYIRLTRLLSFGGFLRPDDKYFWLHRLMRTNSKDDKLFRKRGVRMRE